MTEDRLRDALRRAVPEAPEISFEARPSRVPVPALAAVLVLLALVPLAFVLRPDPAPQLGGGRPRPLPPLTCSAGEAPRGGTLPPGAVAARLCSDAGSTPPDNLTSQVAELVAWVNGQRVRRSGEPCDLMGMPLVRFVFQYAEGPPLVINAEQASCRAIHLGDVQRVGGPALVTKYVELLRAQRAVNPVQPPADLTPPECSAPTDPPVASSVAWHPELVAARLCIQDKDSPGVLLTDVQLRSIIGGLRPGVTGGANCLVDAPPFMLIGITARKEVVILQHSECLQLSSSGGGTWRPDKAGFATLAGLTD